jgi:GTP-binding protein HflX
VATDHQGRQRRRLSATVTDLDVVTQKAYLVSVDILGAGIGDNEQSIAELELLTDTAGSEPVGATILKRRSPSPATLIGDGQARELAAETTALDVDVVVFDNDLTPGQQRNLEKIFKCDVVDRVALILDIFAQHATSRDGMVQVELALLRYHLPRLKGKGTELSRLGGGIGSRGPGETKLETDRRRIAGRMRRLERELATVRKVRANQRKSRSLSRIPLAGLVGYTNAGKSTLLNALTDAGVLTENRLFSTLDSTTRRFDLPNGPPMLLSDTVGFVRRLPHELVEAFRSTLQETAEADFLIHVVDASDEGAPSQIDAVREVLESIEAGSIPELLVLNKSDLADEITLKRLSSLYPTAVVISAKQGTRLTELGERLTELINRSGVTLKLFVPYARGDTLAGLRREAVIVDEHHDNEGTLLTVQISADRAPLYRDFKRT